MTQQEIEQLKVMQQQVCQICDIVREASMTKLKEEGLYDKLAQRFGPLPPIPEASKAYILELAANRLAQASACIGEAMHDLEVFLTPQ